MSYPYHCYKPKEAQEPMSNFTSCNCVQLMMFGCWMLCTTILIIIRYIVLNTHAADAIIYLLSVHIIIIIIIIKSLTSHFSAPRRPCFSLCLPLLSVESVPMSGCEDLHNYDEQAQENGQGYNEEHDSVRIMVCKQPASQVVEEEACSARAHPHNSEHHAGHDDVAVSPDQASGPNGSGEHVDEAGECPQIHFSLWAEENQTKDKDKHSINLEHK